MSSSARPSTASLARALTEARLGRHPQHVYSAQLQEYLIGWFPRDLWSFIYGIPSRAAQGTAAQTRAYQRFSGNPPRVSHEWAAALQLVELACLAEKMSGAAHAKAHHEAGVTRHYSSPEPDLVLYTTEYLLRYGVFPPSGWALTLQLLHRWRARQPPALLQMFPSSLSPPAASQLLHHISLAPPSQGAWQDALCLYHLCVTTAHVSPVQGRPLPCTARTSSPPRSTSDLAAHSAFLKALRHMTLTTLLQAEEWERGLHFFYHTLYQRDLPGPITTSFLVQQLGRVGRWAEVLQVYELCVKLLHARRDQCTPQQQRPFHRDAYDSRMWGTTFSIAMASAQKSPGAPAGTLAAMVRQLLSSLSATDAMPTDVASAAPPPSFPLVRLNGHFLSAVQALPSEEDRLTVLSLARGGSLLDTFKLIRGLLSKHKWEEAMLLFEEAMRFTPARSSTIAAPKQSPSTQLSTPEVTSRQPVGLSRKEIGESRMSFLHEATIDSVAAVVDALNRYRSTTGRRGDGSTHNGGSTFSPSTAEATMHTTRLVLNDREVECVFSKTLTLSEQEHNVPSPAVLATRRDFWRYCLELLAFNYGRLPCDDFCSSAYQSAEDPGRSKGSASPSSRRTPTLAALSFLLRHPQLPWKVALELLQQYGVLGTCKGGRAAADTGAVGRHTASTSVGSHRARTSSSPTPRSLALAATVELLRTQGQLELAEKLALEALELELGERILGPGTVVSLSAALLEVTQYPRLRSLLLERGEKRLRVEATTLFHVLRESTRVEKRPTEGCSGGGVHRTTCEAGGPPSPPWWTSSAAFLNHPGGRALSVVWLLMQRHLYSEMMVVDTFRQEGTSHFLGSLFLRACPPVKVFDAAAGSVSPLRSWLVVYPAAVHCEVLRVIKCLTSPSASSVLCSSSVEEAGWCYAGRWILTRRYLASLAAHFSAACNGSGVREEYVSPVEKGSCAATTDATAREAYYGATFEAVISLLDAPVPRTCALQNGLREGVQMDAIGALTISEEDGGPPHTSARRVQHLQQLLERAIVRYGCFPPTHMLLPNQLNRLLPPLSLSRCHSTAVHPSEGEGRRGFVDGDAVSAERCEVALFLVRLILRALQEARETHSVEPALLHNLLKLCCRIAEYTKAFLADAGREKDTGVDNSAEVSRIGATLVRLQCELCGVGTVRAGTLPLLYHLCAAAQSRASSHGHTVPRQVALETTSYLLERQVAAAFPSSPPRGDYRHRARGGPLPIAMPVSLSAPSRPRPEQPQFDSPNTFSAVQPRHCKLFFSLLGWEDALEVWYRAFPHAVLTQLSDNPQAVEACLSLGEGRTLSPRRHS